MKKLLLPFIFLVLSCENAQIIESDNESGKRYVLETLQELAIDQFYAGESVRNVFKEKMVDRTETEGILLKVKNLSNQIEKIDSLTAIPLTLMNQLRKDQFHLMRESSQIQTASYKNPLYPTQVAYSNVKYAGSSNLWTDESREKMIAAIYSYREAICKALVETTNYIREDRTYTFIDPQIHTFQDQQDFLRQYDQKIQNSSIAMDDADFIRELYWELTKSNNEWEQILSNQKSWTLDFAVLLALENTFLKARKKALMHIRSKISG